MTSRYNYGKRFFSLGLGRLREIRSRGKYRRYYVKPAQSVNPMASNIDFYGLLLAASFVVFTVSTWYTGSPSRGLFVTAPLMTPVVYLAFRIRRALENEARLHNRLWRAGRICQEKIKNIGIDNLNTLVMEILEKIPGYSDVHLIKDRPGEKGDISMCMSVRALREGEPVVVGCVIPDDCDTPVTTEKISYLLEEMKKLDIKGGILVAAGTFSGEARRAALELKKIVTLVDLYRIVDLARKTGHEIFPSGISDGKPEKEIGSFRYKKLFRYALEREKAKNYLFSAGLLLAMYYAAVEAGIFSFTYLIFAMVNIALSLYCIMVNREKDLLGS